MKSLLLELRISLLSTLVFALLLCGAYPATVWLGGRLLFPDKAEGSLLLNDQGTVIGSSLIGQPFAAPKYFHPRPSAAGNAYDATSSSGTNLGPTSARLATEIKAFIAAYRTENGLSNDQPVPADAVTRSGSGLDPHISVSNALLQAARVAAARRLTPETVKSLIIKHSEGPDLALFGDTRVNVLTLNLALDRLP